MPQDISQLRSLLGGVSYYRRYSPDLPHTPESLTILPTIMCEIGVHVGNEKIARHLLDTLSRPLIIVPPDWSTDENG